MRDEPPGKLGRADAVAGGAYAGDGRHCGGGIVGRANPRARSSAARIGRRNLSLLGYDPEVHFTGRAPLEAAAQGIPLGADDWAIRCNL